MISRIPKSVYRLISVLDNPFYGGFATNVDDFDAPSLFGRERRIDDLSRAYGIKNRFSRQEILADRWEPLDVIDETRGYEDFTAINLAYPVFHRRAIGILEDMLLPNGELLPLTIDGRILDYFFFHCLTVTQATILEKSSYTPRSRNPDDIGMGIERLEFDAEKLAGCTIFYEGIDPQMLLVTDEFKDRVEQSQLTGFEFMKLWPLPPGTHYWMEHKKSIANQSTPNLVKQSVVIRIPLPGGVPRPGLQAKIEGFETQIDEALKIQSLTDKFFGRYVGNETTDGEYRMFLSCPSAKELVKKLEPVFLATAGHFPFLVTQRAGPMYKKSAKEKSTAYGAWPE